MGVPRRLVASLLAATLLLAGPLAVPKGCVECPPGCPMHAHDADGAPAKKQPGCHRTPAPPTDTVCLRSACGHDVTLESGLALLALLGRPTEMASPAPGGPVSTPPVIVASLDAPEPPLQPPRAACA
jgi:hypothetical protein